MNNRIWKYTHPITPLDSFKFEVVKNASLLSVELVDTDLWFWFFLNADEPETETVCFSIEGTGQPMVNDYLDDYGYSSEFIKTFFHGPFVWHLFQHWADDVELDELIEEAKTEEAEAAVE